MRRFNLTYHLLLWLFSLLLLAACTTVELCEDPLASHPHRADIRARFHWENANIGENNDEIPSELYFIASRPVNTWRTYGTVDTSKDPNNEPNITRKLSTDDIATVAKSRAEGDGNTNNGDTGTDTGDNTNNGDTGTDTGDNTGGETDGGTDDSTEPEPEPTPEPEPNPWDDPAYFYLRGGSYNIVVINDQFIKEDADLSEQGPTQPEQESAQPEQELQPIEDLPPNEDIPEEEEETTPLRSVFFIENLDNYILDKQIMVSELYLNVKNMGTSNKPEVVQNNDLPDFNPNYEYLEDITTPIYYGIRRNYMVETGKTHIVDFDMTRISQGVNLQLNVRVDADVIIDKPIVELSGICGRYNIYDAHLDTTKLYRIARYSEPLIRISESAEDTVYQVNAKFHTLGLVPSANKSYLNGSGIIQLAIKAHAIQRDDNDNIILNADGTPKMSSRFVYVGINPYDELHAARIIEVRDGKTYMRYDKEDINITIQKELHIEHRHIIEDGGGANWEPADPNNPDGDIKIEF